MTRLPTAFTTAFNVEVPIMSAPMASIAGPRMVAAMAQAGGLGNLPIWTLPPDAARKLIRDTRSRTAQSFAVNVRADLVQTELIAAAADEGVQFFNLFWGACAPSMPAIRAAGGKLIATIGSADDAREALDAGAVALIAQGVEAGGHVFGTTPLAELVPAAVALAGSVPVVAAGGIVDAADMRAALALGAAAVVLGSALIVTREADAHPDYRRALLDARAGDTVLTQCFDGYWPAAPHRVLGNSTFQRWQQAGAPPAGQRPGEGDVILQLPGGIAVQRYSAATAIAGSKGEVEAAALYAGCGVGRIRDVTTVAELVQGLMAGVRAG